ncbi:family 20 glycosylhydrolase [Microbacterium sp. NPDC057650]|uniref:family 20 glycosylhydrolase n=1 Tax=unclassified Microbacterium TaxID=2609290 RepID=UPI00366CA513
MAAVPHLIPAPAHLELTGAAPFRLSSDARIVASDQDIRELAFAAVRVATGRELPVVGSEPGPCDIAFVPGEAGGESPEGHRIEVGDGGIRVMAGDRAGHLAAVQTLRQLLLTPEGEEVEVPALRIEDAPRYAYRGAMLDVARHFFPVDVVLRLIEHISAFKLNHLHLHLTDDQGWRLEIPEYPELTEAGAATQVGGGEGGHYTVDDYRRIVAHGERHGVTVVPEFDMPGHTNAALVAYPALSPAGYDPRPYTETEVGFSTLDIGPESTYEFIDTVIGRIAAETPGPFVHIGGDEARSAADADFTAFMARATRIVREHGKTPVAWHETGKCRDLAEGTIGQYWGYSWEPEEDAAPGRSFVEQGGRLIMSPSDLVYLDIKPTRDYPIGLTWSAPRISLEQAYRWDPATVLSGVPAGAILGVEAPLWTETVQTEGEIDAMFFPRLLAVAERGWAVEPAEWPQFEAAAQAQGDLFTRLGVSPGPAGKGLARKKWRS